MVMEEVVITNESLHAHTVSRYQFKILSALGDENPQETQEETIHSRPQSDSLVETRLIQEPSTSSKDELIESLLKKADDMSSNVIKMQMRLEEMQDEHVKAMETLKKSAFDEGFAAGIAHEQSQSAGKKDRSEDLFAQSVKSLENAAMEFTTALNSIQKELSVTALEIAKEVIGIETHENSGKIAAKLSHDLVEELKEATKITLRVNPSDHGMVSEKVGSLNYVEIISDRAISPGGVVVISDAGNIDSEIKKRYERLKRSLLLE